MKVKPTTIKEVEAAFRDYVAEVDGSLMSQDTKRHYRDGVDRFIRWLRGEFTPGENARSAPPSRR